jgi:hypothetical protein
VTHSSFANFLQCLGVIVIFKLPNHMTFLPARTLDPMFLFTVIVPDQVKFIPTRARVEIIAQYLYLLISLTSMPLVAKEKGAAR